MPNLGRLERAKIHDERDRNRGLHGAVRTLGGAAYYSRAAPRALTKENTTGARADAPSRSCRCAKALTPDQPAIRPLRLGLSQSNRLDRGNI